MTFDVTRFAQSTTPVQFANAKKRRRFQLHHSREGSLGHWAIVIDVRDPQAGKRKQRWYSFKSTKRQAQVECARLISEIQSGTAVEPSRMTVAAFLDRWIEHMQGQVSPRYAENARKPLLGGLMLTKLRPEAVYRPAPAPRGC